MNQQNPTPEDLKEASDLINDVDDDSLRRAHKKLLRSDPEYRRKFNHRLSLEACLRGAQEGVRRALVTTTATPIK